MLVDDGGGGVDGGAFGEREEVLDVIVRVFEGGVGPGEDGWEGAAAGVRGGGCGGVEADGEGEGGIRGCRCCHFGGGVVAWRLYELSVKDCGAGIWAVEKRDRAKGVEVRFKE